MEKCCCKICEQCKENYTSDGSVIGKRFLKRLTGDFSQRQRMPEKFMSSFKGKLPKTVNLKGRGGYPWHIELEESEGDVFLQNAWEDFVTAHNLKENDSLIFEYEGNCSFSVSMFDANHECEKEPIDYFNCSTEDNPHTMHAPTTGRKDAMDLALAFKPSKPSFVSKMTSYDVRASFLTIPTMFARENLPPRDTDIVLHVPGEEEEWNVKFHILNKKILRFGSNWRGFTQDHALKEGDVCVFVLCSDREPLAMTAHIFRA